MLFHDMVRQFREWRLLMRFSPLCLFLPLAFSSVTAVAADGLQLPSSDALWPSLRARLAVQASALSPLSMTSLAAQGGQARGFKGAALFGDYYFAQPSFGSFRASGGLVIGGLGGMPLLSTGVDSRLGLALSRASPSIGSNTSNTSNDSTAPLPYLGLGFSSAASNAGLSVSADLGVVAEGASPFAGAARTLLGLQGADSARRDMRLSPLLQVAMRYTF